MDVVIGGPTSVLYAKKTGVRAWLLYFGPETMNVAIYRGLSIIQTTRAAIERATRMKTILNLFSHGVIVTYGAGTINDCNNSSLDLLEMKREEVLGKKIYNVIQGDSWITSYINGRESRDIIRPYKKNMYFVNDYPILLPDGAIAGSVATFQKSEEIEKLGQKYRKIKTAGLTAKNSFKDIIGVSEAIKAAVEKALSYAQVDSTILIEGETGSGKEIFAQSIHNASKRRYEPFIALNCAALPENLLESELMGYEDGAFTGARRGGKPGLLETADKGTIFLDEINQISPSIQARLLRVLQEKQVLRLGGDKMVPVDIKIIAATNESLEAKVAKGGFREDLYYRLNVLHLPIPPVRLRRDDIPLLLEYFIKYFSKIHGPIKNLSGESLCILTGYDWPGNVREIYNFIERYAVLSKNNAAAEAVLVREYVCKNNILQKEAHSPEEGFLQIKIGTLQNMEKELLEKAVALFHGNKAQAALLLSISRTTLWKKLKD
jgi:transcriptional regulator with PAS, ATPase and Fis domain